MPIAVPLAIAGASVAGAAISANASKKAASTVQQGTDAAVAEQRRQYDDMRRLAMPGYNRAEGAAGIYGQALGLPQMGATGYGQTPAGGVATQPGMMTGAQYGGFQGHQGPTYEMVTAGGQPQTQQPAQTAQQGDPAPANPQLSIADQVMQTPGYQAQLDQGIKSIDRASPLVGGMYSGRRMKALNDYGQNTFGSYYNDWMNRVGGIAGQAPQIAQNVGQAGQQNANNVGQLMMTGANARAQGALNGASAWTGALGNIAGGFAGYYG